MGIYKRGRRIARKAMKMGAYGVAGYLGKKALGLANDRYVKPGLYTGASRAYRDVSNLSMLLNVEKKRIHYYTGSTPTTVGQLNGSTTYGAYATEITPRPQEDNTLSGRNGGSIKWISYHIDFQFYGMSAAQSKARGVIWIVEAKGAPYSSASAALQTFLSPNTFANTLIDYNSQPNPDYFGHFKVLNKKKFVVPADQIASETQITTIKIGQKFKKGKHIRFTADGTIVPTGGNVYMFVLFDTGNINAATASTLTNVPVTAVNTGYNMNFDCVDYYVDN